MSWIDDIKDLIPDWAKDTRLNLDAVINRSTLDSVEAVGCALAAAVASGNTRLVDFISNGMAEHETERTGALTAAGLMAMNNVWYPYIEMADDDNLKGLPAQLRMNAYANHGGVTKEHFESYSLAASIVGKCHFCVRAHYAGLGKMGYSVEQLRDIGRIAAVINSVARVI